MMLRQCQYREGPEQHMANSRISNLEFRISNFLHSGRRRHSHARMLAVGTGPALAAGKRPPLEDLLGFNLRG
jgi:hypothetical protein